MFHYLSADSVAILVLGHLAVREREPGHQLVSFWAPFVLVHLGGQDTITAFSRQDNELWLRHLLNLVTQVAVAGYVVAKASWPDVRLRAAMIITFVSGSIKYAERTLCLYLASPEKVRSNAQNDLSKLQTPDFQPSSLTSYVFDCILEGRYPGNDSGRRETYFFSVDAPQNMLQSTTCANDVPGILQRKFVSNPSRYKSYVYVGEYLEIFYQYRYTKYPLRQMFYYELYEGGCLDRLIKYIGDVCLGVIPCLPVAFSPNSLFTAANKAGQLHPSSSRRSADVTVSYILLVGAIILDASSAAMLVFF